jgi:hypothetical protein
VEQCTSPRSDELASARSTFARFQANQAEPNGVGLQAPLPVPVSARSETALVNLTIPESPPTTCDSPTSFSLSLLSAPSSVEVSFDALPPRQDDAAISDMIAYLVDQNFMQQRLSSTFPTSPISFNSTLLSDSDSSLDDEPYTPVDGHIGELFSVEGGCDTSSGSEYLSHAEFEALLDGTSIEDVNSDSSALVKLCHPMARNLGALFNYPLMVGDFTSIIDSSNWDINQTTSLFDSQRLFSDRFVY